MRKFLSSLLKKIAEMLEKSAPQTIPVEEEHVLLKSIKYKKKSQKKKKRQLFLT